METITPTILHLHMDSHRIIGEEDLKKLSTRISCAEDEGGIIWDQGVHLESQPLYKCHRGEELHLAGPWQKTWVLFWSFYEV